MVKAPDHSAKTRSIGKNPPSRDGGKLTAAPAQAGHNQPKQKHKLRIRHSSFGGRSSCLDEATFDLNTETLTVVFAKDGSEYDYDCTLENWQSLKDADSVGEEFNLNIK